MKTTKIFSVLSLAMVFTVVTSAFANVIGKKDVTPSNAMIRYAVNVVSQMEKPLAATYMIKVFNEKYQLVAPPKIFIPGQSQYVFYERGPADGVRIAVLVKAPLHEGGIEPNVILYAEPAIVKGPFEVGQTYRFDLYPKLIGGHK
jgi:hypothetical protein